MNYIVYWLLLICVLLFINARLIHQLSLSEFVYLGGKESFALNRNENETSTVDMPINTPYSCQNFCGPASRCAITGQQCFSDTDCPGCKLNKKMGEQKTMHVAGDNAAGKMTFGQTPQYSALTSGYGTMQFALKHANKPDQPNFGVNIWKPEFDETTALFNRRYKPPNTEFTPAHKMIYSLTGEFATDGPLPSNY